MSAEELLRSHASQVARLPSLVAAGVIEIRWGDDKGEHFEQGDLDLRYRAPDDLSMRVSKVGETQFMGGCNAARWWWFEGWSKPTRFWSRPRDAARSPDDANRPPITMDEMLALMGLRTMTTSTAVPGMVEKHPDDPAWSARLVVDLGPEQSVLGLPTRVLYDVRQVPGEGIWLPVRIEVLDGSGALLIASDLEHFRRVERRDAPPGDWPVIATRVRVEVPERGERGAFRWFVALDRPSASGERIVERLFDPDAVRESLRPQIIDDSVAGAP